MLSKKTCLIIASVFAWCFTTGPALASHVPGDYATIQEALDNAAAGEEIVVTDGAYFENLVWPDLQNITLRSESGNAEDCVIDGSSLVAPVIKVESTLPVQLSIRDLTVRSGTQDSYSSAAGIYIATQGTATVQRCILRGNHGYAVKVEGGNVFLTGNEILQNDASPDDLNGGIVADGGTVSITDNVLTDNEALIDINVYSIIQDTVTIERNIIQTHGLIGISLSSTLEATAYIGQNHITTESQYCLGILLGGGNVEALNAVVEENYIEVLQPAESYELAGIGVGNGGTYDIRRNTIRMVSHPENENIFLAGVEIRLRDGVLNIERNTISGGGFGILDNYEDVQHEGESVIINNNIIYNNIAGISGGNDSDCTYVINNNTIADNDSIGIGFSVASTNVQVTNCILWGNGDDLFNTTATYSDVEDGDPGAGNISMDPQFVGPSQGDYHLMPTSDCIDAGTNSVPDLPAMDFDNDARILNGVVDMGADEYTGNTPAGTGVTVAFSEAGTEVTFATVVQDGQTTVDKHIGDPPAPDGFLLLSEPSFVYDVESSAGYENDILVCVNYEDPAGTVDETLIRLLHEEAGAYVDRTVLPVDTANNIVCAEVTGFSGFLPAVLECVDADEDGYADVACGGTDCDDGEPAVNPGAAEICTNTIDDNCDGLADGQDPDCQEPDWAVASIVQASTSEGSPDGRSQSANWLMVLLIATGLLFVQRRIFSRKI